MKLPMFLTTMVAFPFALSAQPFSIQDMDVSMSIEQVLSEALERGYVCADEGADAEWHSWSCTKDDGSEISLSTRVADGSTWGITFNCEATRTCDYADRDVVQMLVQNGVIPESESAPSNAGTRWIGADGDRLVVMMGKIFLIRDNYGNAPTFD